jgi:MFS family permease
MRAILLRLWPLFLAVALIQVANGVQSDLVGVRASDEGFPASLIGLVLACYYVGYSTAPLVSRPIIARLGHGATIAASAVAAAILIVAHAFFIAPLVWALFRFGVGFSLSIGYVAIESWINDHVENAARGRVFSTYVLVQLIAMTFAQAIFGAGDPRNIWLFVVAGLLFAAGAAPVGALGHARTTAPPEPLGVVKLFRAAPLGAAATALAGLSWAVVVTFGPIYAQRSGLTIAETGVFMGAAMAGGMLLQFPLGWVSDHFGRRRTIALMSAAAVAASLFGIWADAHGALAKDTAMLFIGGSVFTLYAIAVARTNDAVAPQNRVAAAAGLVMLFGLGSIAGPLIGGWALAAFGPPAFFGVMAVVMSLSLAVAAVTR